MDTRTLESGPGFLITDLPDAEIAVGPVRLGSKLIPGNATNYAREITYGFGLLGQKASGMTAGLKVDVEARDDAVNGLAGELAAQLSSGAIRCDPGLRAPASAITALTADDPRPAARLADHGHGTLADHLEARGVVAAARAVLGDLDGRRITVEGNGAVALEAMAALVAAGAKIVRVGALKTAVSGDALDPAAIAAATDGEALAALGESAAAWTVWKGDVDLVVAGSAPGALKDQGAAALGATPVVTYGTAPVATKALATSMKAGGTVVPSFLTGIGRRVADLADSDASADALIASTDEALAAGLEASVGHERGAFVGACLAAEAFIAGWTTPPFGRPLA